MIRILALVEAATVTGPAKNLLHFAETARRTAPGAVELMIATFRRGAVRGDDPFLFAVAAAGIPVDVIDERSRLGRRHASGLRALTASQRPDIIQTHSVKSHFLVRLAGLDRSAAWVAFHHGYTATDLKMRAYNQLDRWSLRAPRRVVTVSEAFARQLACIGVAAERIVVIHNAADRCLAERVGACCRSRLRAELGVEMEERVVLAVGRLSREKAIEDLVKAAAGLQCVRLVIVGDGPERSRIEKAAFACGARVTMAGQQEDVAPYYAIADVLAIPSLTEGSPNALIEAMSAGVPVVATAVGGVPEIVADGESALLVKPREPVALSHAIGALLSDTDLANRIAAAARERVRQCFSPEARTQRLLDLYREVAGGA